jgi:hypothetical protein
MKWSVRDGIASVLVAAIVIPYVGYVVRGEMPFIEDPRGMSAVGLVLGVAAFLVAGARINPGVWGKVEIALALITLTVGFVALVFAEAAAAEALLAAFIVMIVAYWAVTMLDHGGFLGGAGTPPAELRP